MDKGAITDYLHQAIFQNNVCASYLNGTGGQIAWNSGRNQINWLIVPNIERNTLGSALRNWF